MKTSFIVVLILLSVGVSFAQTKPARTVTNSDLEKYRQDRLKAEKEYRENHQRLGLPSPEELEQRRTDDAKAAAELSARLRYERESREYAQAQQAASASTTYFVPQQYYVNEGNYRRSIYGYAPYYNYYQRPRPPYGNYQDWRATPGGIVYEPGGRSSNIWTPRSTRTAPVFRPVTPR